MNKKNVAGALVLSMSLVCSSAISYATEFSDMQKHWAATYVDDVVGKGVIKGYDDNTFRPSRPVTKLESIVMITKLYDDATIDDVYNKNKAKYQATMTKSKIPVWAEKYVVFGVERKLFPEKSIPFFMNKTKGTHVQSLSFRQEFAMLLVNAIGLNKEFAKTPTVKYKDAASIDAKALPYIEVLGRKGVIQTTGSFNPKAKVTRAEAAVMISKAYQYSPKGKNANATKPAVPTPSPGTSTESSVNYSGKLTSIFINGNTVTVNMTDAKGVPKIFSNESSKVTITIDGKAAKPEDVKSNSDVVVSAVGSTLNSLQVSSSASSVISTPPQVQKPEEMGQVVGKVESYKDNKFEVKEGNEVKAFWFDNNTKVLLNGKEGKDTDIRTGDSVTLVTLGTKVIQAIVTSNSQTVSGTVRAIGKDTISISTGAEVLRFDVTSSTRIYRGNSRLDSLDQLYVGEKVTVKANGFEATGIEVEESKLNLRSVIVVGVSLNSSRSPEIVVEDKDGQSYTLVTDSKTKIYVRDRLKTMDDIKLGYEIDLKAENGVVSEISTEGEFSTSRIQGKVVSIDIKTETMVVDTGKREVTVHVLPNTEVRNSYNNTKRSIDNIFKNYEVIVNGVSRAGGIDAERVIYFE